MRGVDCVLVGAGSMCYYSWGEVDCKRLDFATDVCSQSNNYFGPGVQYYIRIMEPRVALVYVDVITYAVSCS